MPTARLLGTALRRLVGGAELSLEGATVAEVLRALCGRGGAELEAALLEGPALGRDARVLLNGRSVTDLEGLETPVGPDDTVTVYFFGARSLPGG